MQQIFLFLTMLIAASEAFLNGSHISTSNKRKMSGFVPNARIIKSVNPVFGNMDFPVKIRGGPGTIPPRDEPTFLNLCARHKRFSNDDRTSFKKLDNVSFLRDRKFLSGRNNSRKLRSMRRKRKLISSPPTTATTNVNSYPGSKNSNLPSVISLLDSPLNSNKIYEKVPHRKSRGKVFKKKQIKDLHYLPCNSKQLLKYSTLRRKLKDFKRHRRFGPRNVKKQKRDAEIVNNSKANVTKGVKEKNLNDVDSLDDSYFEDLYPEFATQHLGDSLSDWQKYLGLSSQAEKPYLLPSVPDDIDYYDSAFDIPPPTMWVPRMNFQIPYDRRIYEDTSFEGDNNNDAKLFRKLETEEVTENDKKKKKSKKRDKKFESFRLDRLKHMLDNVENALKEEKTSSKTIMKAGRGGRKLEDGEDSFRAKIEVVIPLLSQISQELGKRSSELQQSGDRKINFPEETVKEGKGNRTKSAACSLDGIWSSKVMGLEINMSTQSNLMLRVNLKPIRKGGIIDGNWYMHGLTLSKTDGPFILAAISPGKRKIASFIGQCWIYEEKEFVYGSWMIYTEEHKITGLLTAVNTKSDVLTRKRYTDEIPELECSNGLRMINVLRSHFGS